MDVLSAPELMRGFANRSKFEVSLVDIGGRLPVPVRVYPAKGARSLVVLFHGAIIGRQGRLRPFCSTVLVLILSLIKSLWRTRVLHYQKS